MLGQGPSPNRHCSEAERRNTIKSFCRVAKKTVYETRLKVITRLWPVAFAIFSRPAVAYNRRGGSFNGSAWYTGAGIHFHSGLPAVRSGDDAAESRRQEVTKLFSGDNLSNRGSPENYPL